MIKLLTPAKKRQKYENTVRILYHIDSKLFYSQLMQSMPDITNRPSRRKQHLMGEISPQLPFLLSLLSVKMSLPAGKLQELHKINISFKKNTFVHFPHLIQTFGFGNTRFLEYLQLKITHPIKIVEITNPSSEEKDESSGLMGNVIQDLHNSQQLTLSQVGTRALVHKSVKK